MNQSSAAAVPVFVVPILNWENSSMIKLFKPMNFTSRQVIEKKAMLMNAIPMYQNDSTLSKHGCKSNICPLSRLNPY